jgi:hypothetical protein
VRTIVIEVAAVFKKGQVLPGRQGLLCFEQKENIYKNKRG